LVKPHWLCNSCTVTFWKATIPPFRVWTGLLFHSTLVTNQNNLLTTDILKKRCLVDHESSILEIDDRGFSNPESFQYVIGLYSIYKIILSFYIDHFRTLYENDLHLIDAFLFVYSIDSRHSFEQVERCYQFILQRTDRFTFPTVLIGNKCDLEGKRVVNASG